MGISHDITHQLWHGGFLSHRGTPSHHPFVDGILVNQPFWIPPWLWKAHRHVPITWPFDIQRELFSGKAKDIKTVSSWCFIDFHRWCWDDSWMTLLWYMVIWSCWGWEHLEDCAAKGARWNETHGVDPWKIWGLTDDTGGYIVTTNYNQKMFGFVRKLDIAAMPAF